MTLGEKTHAKLHLKSSEVAVSDQLEKAVDEIKNATPPTIKIDAPHEKAKMKAVVEQ